MEGFKVYRHADNPEEKLFHDKFAEFDLENASAITLPLNEHGTAPKEYLTDREHKIVLSAIQWLGSPVGQGFLNELGYKKVKVKMSDADRRAVVKACHKRAKSKTIWNEMLESDQDVLIQDECMKMGFSYTEFYAANGKFLNKILGW